jgi:NADH:ubiquinone oxidoreductase subunit 4 (subunit M)
MLWFAQRFLYGTTRVPHGPVPDLNRREKLILAALMVPVFWIGLAPGEPMRKTEAAALHFQRLVGGAQAAATAPAAPLAQRGVEATR